MKYPLLVFSLLLFSLSCFGQNPDSTKIYFAIEQIIMPGPNPIYSYKIKNKRVTVYKEPLIFGKNLGIKERISSSKLNDKDYQEILSILQEMSQKEYERAYSSHILDGICWMVKIDYLDRKTEIDIFNTSIPEIERILEIVNSGSDTKGIISFDHLGGD